MQCSDIPTQVTTAITCSCSLGRQGNHPEFSSVPMSLARTFNMMLGEIDFLTVYVYPWLSNSNSTHVGGGGRRSGFAASHGTAGNLTTPVVPR